MNLYEFEGRSPTRYLTNNKSNLVVGSQRYTSLAIRRSTYRLDALKTKSNMTIIFPGDDQWALDLVRPNDYKITVQVKSISGQTFWIGELLEINVQTDRRIKMTFRPRQSVRETLGERRMFQHHCPYLLYGDNCKAEVRRVPALVVDFTNPDKRIIKVNPILLPTDTNISFEGGFVSLGDPFGDYWIINVDTSPSDGIIITSQLPLPSVITSAVTIIAGCDRTPIQCHRPHTNLRNFGGFWGLRNSPFDGALSL